MTQENALVCTYGPSGSGKTTDMGYSFPTALFIATPGALHCVRHVCGYDPVRRDASTIRELNAILSKLTKTQEFSTIVIDDFSFMAEKTVAYYQEKFSRKGQGWQMWSSVYSDVLEFRELARQANCHVVFNCWEQPPKTQDSGQFIKGGPLMTGKLSKIIPTVCDIVLRCDRDPMRKPWSGIYRCSFDNNYVMKDRFDKCYTLSPAPMNLAEILRASGYEIARHPSHPWQEDAVEELSQHIATLTPTSFTQTVNQLFGQLLEAGIDPKAARWTLRDALDRVVIRRAISTQNSRFLA